MKLLQKYYILAESERYKQEPKYSQINNFNFIKSKCNLNIFQKCKEIAHFPVVGIKVKIGVTKFSIYSTFYCICTHTKIHCKLYMTQILYIDETQYTYFTCMSSFMNNKSRFFPKKLITTHM